MTTLIDLSAVSWTSLENSGSLPFDMSVPLSNLAITILSVALDPSGEEEHPMLFLKCHTNPPMKMNKRGPPATATMAIWHTVCHVAHYLQRRMVINKSKGGHYTIAASHTFSSSSEKLLNPNNNSKNCSTNIGGFTNYQLPHLWYSSDRMFIKDTKEPQWEHSSFLAMDSTTALLLRAMYSSRTNPASPNDGLHIKSSSITTKNDPITV